MENKTNDRVRLLIIFSMIVFMIQACCDSKKFEYKYDLTYTDGTTETITSDRKIRNIGEADCVGVCDCSNRKRWCGVRKYELVSTKEVKKTKSERKVKKSYKFIQD